MQEHYERVPVRDGLAGERTVLAAERTFLAYVRTSFALVVAGITGAQLLPRELALASWAVASLGGITFVIGIDRFRRSRAATVRMLARLEKGEE